MLLTTCPNCGAKFKVSTEQLNVRQGRVMCGRCRHVFNAFEALKRIEDNDAGEPIDYTLPDSTRETDTAQQIPLLDTQTAAQPAANEDQAEKMAADEALDSDDDALKKLEPFEQSQLAPEPPPIPTDETREGSGAPLDEAATSVEQLPPHDLEAWPGAHGAAEPSPEPALATTPDIDSSVGPDAQVVSTTNPLIGGSTPARAVRSRAWGWLAAAAGVLFALQSAFYFRSEIAQQYPQLRPQMAAACDAIGCAISWGRDTALIKIESSDLIEPPGRPGRILLTATLANRAATKQDFPALEVKLTDANNSVLSSRILMPSEYLGRVPAAGEGLAPNIELYVNLNLELAGKSPASGYGLRAFYP